MELHIEAADGFSLPNGSFISVRLGELLKQRRYEPTSCSYSFPVPERRRHAKIDLYQHVGTCSAVVDPESISSSEVRMVALDQGGPELRLKVSATIKNEVAAKETAKDREERSAAAKRVAVDYLSKHQVEEKLGDAIRMLLKRRPEDPIDFICNFLKASGDQTAPRPAEPAAAKPVAAKPMPKGAELTALMASNVELPGLWTPIYKKFPAYVTHAAPPAPMPRSGIQAEPVEQFQVLPSVGTWFQRRLPKLPLPTSLPSGCATSAWILEGVRAPKVMSLDERFEVERVLTRALCELAGELEGEYFPLQSSVSYAPRPAGMSEDELRELTSSGLVFHVSDSLGRGVFITNAQDAAAWINPEGHHVQFIVKQAGNPEATAAKLRLFEAAVRGSLRQDGLDFLKPSYGTPEGSAESAWIFQGIRPPTQMSLDERYEVERVVTKALSELVGELEGEYFPLPTSTSYAPRPAGVSEDELRSLAGSGLIFQVSDSFGRGIFLTSSKDAAVWINPEGHHVQFIVKQVANDPKAALGKLHCLEAAVRDILRQDGLDCLEPSK